MLMPCALFTDSQWKWTMMSLCLRMTGTRAFHVAGKSLRPEFLSIRRTRNESLGYPNASLQSALLLQTIPVDVVAGCLSEIGQNWSVSMPWWTMLSMPIALAPKLLMATALETFGKSVNQPGGWLYPSTGI